MKPLCSRDPQRNLLKWTQNSTHSEVQWIVSMHCSVQNSVLLIVNLPLLCSEVFLWIRRVHYKKVLLSIHTRGSLCVIVLHGRIPCTLYPMYCICHFLKAIAGWVSKYLTHTSPPVYIIHALSPPIYTTDLPIFSTVPWLVFLKHFFRHSPPWPWSSWVAYNPAGE